MQQENKGPLMFNGVFAVQLTPKYQQEEPHTTGWTLPPTSPFSQFVV